MTTEEAAGDDSTAEGPSESNNAVLEATGAPGAATTPTRSAPDGESAGAVTAAAAAAAAAEASTQEPTKAGSRALNEEDGDDTKMEEVDDDDGRDHDDHSDDDPALLEETLFRLTRGLPRYELQTAVEEAHAVEELLLQEIRELEQALQRHTEKKVPTAKPLPAPGEEEGLSKRSSTRGEGENVAATTDTKETEQPAKRKKEEEGDEKEATVVGERAAHDEGDGDDDDDDGDDEESAVRAILESCPYTPLDGYWTISALLGRLRDDMALPPSPMPLQARSATTAATAADAGSLAAAAAATATATARPDSSVAAAGGGVGGGVGPALEGRSPKNDADGESDAAWLLELEKHPDYGAVHDTPLALLALHKKIATHRSSAVFKKPVKVDDAPGYDARILFPVDLASIRKQIVARQVVSFRDLHDRIGMIAHNCCKYNGRESDYGQVAREFERIGDEMIRQAVLNPQGLVPGVMLPQQQQQLQPSLPSSQSGGRKSTPVGGAGGHGGSETQVESSVDPGSSAPAETDPTAFAEAKAPSPAPTVSLPTDEGASTPTTNTNEPPGGSPLPSAPKLPPSTAAASKNDNDATTADASSAKPSEATQ